MNGGATPGRSSTGDLRPERQRGGDRRAADRIRVAVAGERSVGWSAPLELAGAIVRAHGVVRALVGRDIRSRYAGSVFGALWSVAYPVVQLATFTFVFATVLELRVVAFAGRDVPFVLYLSCGLFPWLAVQESITRSATCVVDNPTLVKRVVFPVEVLPVQLACSAIVHQAIATAVLVAVMAVVDFPPRPSFVALPLLAVIQLLLTVGVGWAVAALHVHFRDTAHAVGLLMPVGFYLTPILYPRELVPASLRPLLAMNPLSSLVQGYRDVLLRGAWPDGLEMAWLLTVALGVFAAGALVFTAARAEFADLI